MKGATAVRSSDEVRSEIERTREELVTGLLSLRGEMKRATDWRTYFDRRPLVWLGLALGLGLLAGFRPMKTMKGRRIT